MMLREWHATMRCAGFWIGLLLMLLGGCGFSGSREDAAEIMEHYFTAIEARDYHAATAYYAAAFFEKTPRDRWEATLQGYNRELGDLEHYAAVRWNVKKHVGVDGGTFVQVTYKTSYSRHPATETFILQKGDAGFRIIAHRVQAKGAPKGGKTEFI
jgi:hypothetical protein